MIPKMRPECTGFIIVCIVFVSLTHCVSGLTCEPGRNANFLERLNRISCPQDDMEKNFCCKNEFGDMYCCDASEILKNGVDIVVPVIIFVVIILLIASCLCCCCCPCCLLYKRRHNGTVYGRVQQTTVVAVPQPVNQQYNSQIVKPYPTNPGVMPQPMQAVGPQPMQAVGPQPVPTPMPQPGIGFSNQVAYPDYSAQPPPYSFATANEGYAKQAPFNPNF